MPILFQEPFKSYVCVWHVLCNKEAVNRGSDGLHDWLLVGSVRLGVSTQNVLLLWVYAAAQ